jgi:hypothetical protein
MKKLLLIIAAASCLPALVASDFGDAISNLSTSGSSANKSTDESSGSAPKLAEKHVVKHTEQRAQKAPEEPQGAQILVPQEQQQQLNLFLPDAKIPSKLNGAIAYYGDFTIDVLQGDGELWLKPANSTGLFSRTFAIANNDLPASGIIQNPSRRLVIRIPKNDPLIVTQRMLGIYHVSVSVQNWGVILQAVRASF